LIFINRQEGDAKCLEKVLHFLGEYYDGDFCPDWQFLQRSLQERRRK